MIPRKMMKQFQLRAQKAKEKNPTDPEGLAAQGFILDKAGRIVPGPEMQERMDSTVSGSQPRDPPLRGNFHRFPNNEWGAMVKHVHAAIEGKQVILKGKKKKEGQVFWIQSVEKIYPQIDNTVECLCKISR